MKTKEELLELKQKVEDSIQYHLRICFELKESCWHPEDQIVKKSQYYEGGYDYKAETVYWEECSICGEKINCKTKTHSWYG